MPNPASTVAPPLLEIQGLCFGYPGRPLLQHLSLRIGPGLTVVQGDDGSGKTSLLRLLAGTLQAQSGTLQLDGIALAAMDASQVFYAEPADTGPDALSVRQWHQAVQQRYPRFNQALWATLLDTLGLLPHQEKQLYMLSTGSKRKLLLAAAAASGARLPLLEQVFAALDQRSVQVVRQLLAQACGQSDRIWVLADYQAPPDLPLAQLITLPGQA